MKILMLRATTHWLALDALAAYGATPVKERWVIDRNRAARAVQLGLEDAPSSPFDSGTPETAGAKTVERVRSWFGSR